MKKKEQEKTNVWYEFVGHGLHKEKYNSLEEILKYQQNSPYFPVLKIIKHTKEVLPQEVVDEINSQVNYRNKVKVYEKKK